jgi:hypothetical protein
MDLEKQERDYFDFCLEYFPKSVWNNGKSISNKKSFFNNVNKSIHFLTVLNGIGRLPDRSKPFITDSIILLKRSLYCAPINDILLYAAVMRGLSESLLKIAYSAIDMELSIEKVRTVKYRNMTDILMGDAMFSTFMGKETSAIMNLYGKYSEEIHGTKAYYDVKFLSQLMKKEGSLDYNKLKSESQQILFYCQKYLFALFNIDDSKLSFTNKSILQKLK